MKYILEKLLQKRAPSSVASNTLALQALDVLAMPTLIINSAGVVVYVNKAVVTNLGWQISELLDTDVTQLFAEIEQHRLQPLLFAYGTSSSTKPATSDTPSAIFTKDQKLLHVKLSVAHFDYHGGSHVCMSIDFAHLESLELRLAREQAAKFHQASENKSSFLASISHEIRTPLGGVLGMIDVLASSTLDANQRTYLSSLKKSARNLRSLIDDVLDFSKIEAGMVTLEVAPFDVVETLHSVVMAFKPTANAKGVALKFEHDLPHAQYLGDSFRLTQVVNNLVSNALKFTERGEVTIKASSSPSDSDLDLAHLTVAISDTGQGIEPALQEGIFDSFHQANLSISRTHGGSGLGLFICKKLIKLMHGSISVRSKPNEGSTFEISVALQQHFELVQLQETEPPAQLRTLIGTRILVVEDDLTNQLLIQAWLHQAGCSVVCCANGQEALNEIAKIDYFDVVLMDITMPVMDGLTATQHIRRPQPLAGHDRQHYLTTLPILGISGHTLSDDLACCINAGMMGNLTKPLSRTVLQLKLIEVISAVKPRNVHF